MSYTHALELGNLWGVDFAHELTHVGLEAVLLESGWGKHCSFYVRSVSITYLERFLGPQPIFLPLFLLRNSQVKVFSGSFGGLYIS